MAGDALEAAPFILVVEVEGRPELSCRYLPQVPILAPTAWRLRITVLNESRRLTTPEKWFEHGGMVIERAHPAYTVFTPSVEGVFNLKLARDTSEENAPKTTVRLYTITPVEPDSRGRLKISGRRETYPRPSRAKSKCVKENAACYKPPLLFCALAQWKNRELAPGLMGEVFLPVNKSGKRPTQVFPAAPAIINKVAIARIILKEKGFDPKALRVVSGFRPPSYNRSVGGASYSRHMYGDALDFIYDADNNEKMDDINEDSKVDRKDGIFLAEIFRQAEAAGSVPGGIGVYEYPSPKSRLSHVHVDARGYITRWGTTYRTRKPGEFKWWPEGEFENEEENE